MAAGFATGESPNSNTQSAATARRHHRSRISELNENLSQADRYLLDQVRQGSSTGWSQLVERYQGRLLTYARRKLGAASDAEDLVQEVFISFLKGLPQFRGEAALETYLFLILRRRIVNWLRGRRANVCSLQDTVGGSDEDSGVSHEPAGTEPTASWYARRQEEHAGQRTALSAALRETIDELKSARNFRELQIVEMIFYCQLRNIDVARIAQVRDNHVAVVKHRLLARLETRVSEHLPPASSSQGPGPAGFELPDALLTQIWQDERLSCLKRSTIGAYVLGTLEPDWQEYVHFHLEQLGCQFCRANLEDMQDAIQEGSTQQLRRKIMDSTVGFFRPESR